MNFIFSLILALNGHADSIGSVHTVPSVDLQKYQGLWYEVAKIPNRFQKQCLSNTTAEYTLLDSGLVKVVNSCRTKDGMDVIEGRAKIVDTETNAKLKVTFAKILGNWIYAFGGKYWVLGLADDYSWAVVGEPSRQYAWILSRTQVMSDANLEIAKTILEDNGYKWSKLEMSK